MLRKLLLAGTFAGVALTTPLAAQSAWGPSFGLTPYAGYIKFGSLISGPFGTSIRDASSAVYGAEAQLGLTKGIALVGNVAYSQPDLQVGAPLICGVSVGRSSVLLYDGALRLRVAGDGRASYLAVHQGGAGAVRQSFDIGPATTHATNFAYNVGAGADLGARPTAGVQLMVKDYIGKFDAQQATSIVDTKTTHNWAVSAGLRLGL
jgi:hypothetical protein